jgi:Ulp1 family protease
MLNASKRSTKTKEAKASITGKHALYGGPTLETVTSTSLQSNEPARKQKSKVEPISMVWRSLNEDQWNIVENEYRSVSKCLADSTYVHFRAEHLNEDIPLCNRDIIRYHGDNWLLGENIDAFLFSVKPSQQQYHLVSSTYFSIIAQEYQPNIKKRWTYLTPAHRYFETIDQMKLDILIPVHKPLHWIPVVISFRSNTIFIKNSLFRNQSKVATVLIKW